VAAKNNGLNFISLVIGFAVSLSIWRGVGKPGMNEWLISEVKTRCVKKEIQKKILIRTPYRHGSTGDRRCVSAGRLLPEGFQPRIFLNPSI
jgi:hypothetical protein